MPSISYIITLYNKRPFLPVLVAGLLAQQGDFSRQFVFIDDGSRDGTPDALRTLLGSRDDVLIIEQANAGPAAATNRGIAAASGDFIKPVDGDDVLGPRVSALLLQAMQQTGCAMAYVDMTRQGLYDPAASVESVMAAFADGPARIWAETDSLQRCLRNAYFNPTAWMGRRDMVRHAGGCDEGVFIQDYSIALRMARLTNFACVSADRLIQTPNQAEQRLSDDGRQILHDLNLALGRFLQQNPDLPPALVHYAIGRLTRRAWSWAKRREKQGFLSAAFRTHLAGLLRLHRPGPDLTQAVCAPFVFSKPVRRTMDAMDVSIGFSPGSSL